DSITFLALFGFFAGQVTGSYVVAGAELVGDGRGVVGKLLSLPAFAAGAVAAALPIIVLRERKRSALPVVFALELALLVAFASMMASIWPISDPNHWTTALAGCLAAGAIGVQNALTRLLLPSMPPTIVMVGNSTQLAIDATELIYTWFRPQRIAGDPDLAAHVAEARRRFVTILLVLMGFLIGAIGGATAFSVCGPWSVCLAIAIVAVLVGWAAIRRVDI
ncbi:MAG: DUF1275 domain-containing protein, partial [Rhizobiales bacterium]|nr:DUF1275 domain-containing protein [Hyphomicrobiales bacterium]